MFPSLGFRLSSKSWILIEDLILKTLNSVFPVSIFEKWVRLDLDLQCLFPLLQMFKSDISSNILKCKLLQHHSIRRKTARTFIYKKYANSLTNIIGIPTVFLFVAKNVANCFSFQKLFSFYLQLTFSVQSFHHDSSWDQSNKTCFTLTTIYKHEIMLYLRKYLSRNLRSKHSIAGFLNLVYLSPKGYAKSSRGHPKSSMVCKL